MDAYVPASADLRRQLDEARVMLESGEVEAARSLASAVLRSAQSQSDGSLAGQALLALAQYDRVVGRFRRAIHTAQQAVQLFQLNGDIFGEASALSLVAHSSSILGRDEDAVEAALLSVKLGDLMPPGPAQVILYNYLGVSYLWSKSFANAESTLRESERMALLYAPESNVLLPRTNLAWLEALRLFEERYFSGDMPSTESLRQRLVMCSAMLEDDVPFGGLPGVRSVLQRFARLTQALCWCWEGKPEAAERQLAAADDPTKPGHYARVADVIVHWVRAELSMARNDLQAAQREASTLIERAGRAEFEQMAYLGHLLLTQIYAKQGRFTDAMNEERTLRRRELRVRADILEGRHRVVQTYLDVRTSARHLQQLARHSQELERLSFEDSLTGIPNRRRFEHQMEASLTDGSNPPQTMCVALIDIDDFKRINDTHSHAAGDEVLKKVAQVIQAVVRNSDLAARLGGDEFVVLFPRTSLEVAQEVCERIHAGLSDLRWSHLDPALTVGVSIGIAQAQPGDSPAALLQRSDLAMFRAKAMA